jgi:hypothetical protein
VKNNRNTVIILFALLGAVLLIYFIFFSDDEKRYQWYESYRVDSDQPYGTLFIQKMLEDYKPDGDFTLNDKKPVKILLSDVSANSNYVFIGQSLHLDFDDTGALIKFLERGGNVFIASLEPPESLLTAVYFKECGAQISFKTNEQDSVDLNFYHKSLQTERGINYAFRYGTEDNPYSWNFINEDVFCETSQSIVPLGYQNTYRVNFIRIAAGKGNLFLHTNPLVFTNYFLTKPEKMKYASGVFSHLAGKHIIWDEYSKVPYSGNNNAYNSPLYYILQQPSLKYAWWLLLLTVVLYVLFGAKRKQRIIPVHEPKTNTSLEFVKLISRLHYQNGNHVDMARKKMKAKENEIFSILCPVKIWHTRRDVQRTGDSQAGREGQPELRPGARNF